MTDLSPPANIGTLMNQTESGEGKSRDDISDSQILDWLEVNPIHEWGIADAEQYHVDGVLFGSIRFALKQLMKRNGDLRHE